MQNLISNRKSLMPHKCPPYYTKKSTTRLLCLFVDDKAISPLKVEKYVLFEKKTKLPDKQMNDNMRRLGIWI